MKKQQTKKKWAELGLQSIQDRDLTAAKVYLQRAIKSDKNSASCRYDLALVHEAREEFGDAAEQFTEALRINPMMGEATRHLGLLVSRGALPGDVRLNRWGLKAALKNEVVNRDQIAEAAIYSLAREEPFCGDLEYGRSEGWDSAARRICLKKTGPFLKDELFLTALKDNVIRMPDLEHLLTAVRRVLLLELPAERLQDRALTNLILALMQQCRVNEYVWAVSDDEADFLKSNPVPIEAASSGDVTAGIRLAIFALYQPVFELLGDDFAQERISAIRPQTVQDLVSQQFSDAKAEKEHAGRIRQLGSVSNDTSQRVSKQYSENPYPRWTSLGLLIRAGDWKQALSRYFPADRLTFMDQPYEVLIAGCGTGLQAIAAAFAYGPNAKITAIDISLPSLAYARRMADFFGATNIEFYKADISEIGDIQEFASRFHVIECVGVLHHMADPYQGWRAITQCLADGGTMLIGLYSATARSDLNALRKDPIYPGVGCDDAQLRTFRNALMNRSDDELGSEFKGIRDLYTTGSFRDLLLHVQEHCHTLPEIETFLNETNLVFRGFLDENLFTDFEKRFTDETWPGKLHRWAEFEQENPKRFGNMYRFWCDKA